MERGKTAFQSSHSSYFSSRHPEYTFQVYDIALTNRENFCCNYINVKCQKSIHHFCPLYTANFALVVLSGWIELFSYYFCFGHALWENMDLELLKTIWTICSQKISSCMKIFLNQFTLLGTLLLINITWRICVYVGVSAIKTYSFSVDIIQHAYALKAPT